MAFTESEVNEAHAALESAPDADDLNRLGLIYSTGDGPSLDMVEAHKWFNLAALHGCMEAKTYRSELAEQMATAQILKAQRKARKWLQGHKIS